MVKYSTESYHVFYKVSRSVLLHKLHNYGNDGKVNSWIESFSYNRTQTLIIEGDKWIYVHVESGVPQESLLGPSIFLYYMNDISVGLNSDIRLFPANTIESMSIKSFIDT